MSAQFESSRKMQLTTPLTKDSLFLTEFAGSEQISGLYKFQLSVQAPRRKPVEFQALLGQDIRVDIELPSPKWADALTTGKLPESKYRRFCGLVQEITELNSDTYFVYYQLTMQPRFWLWTQKADCRIFQEQTVAEILKSSLEGLNVDFRLHNKYVARPYCVQYNETTYDFVTRLMAEEGIFYFFEHQYDEQDNQHQRQGEKLIITDSVINLPSVSSTDPSSSGQSRQVPQLKFDDAAGGLRTELRIDKWHRSQKIVTSKCTLRDHTFQLPGQSLETNEEVPDQVTIAAKQYKLAPLDHELEVYEYPGQFAKQFDGIGPGGGERPDKLKDLFQHNALFSKREIERCASESIQIKGTSDCLQMTAGYKFQLLKENVVSGPYFVKSVKHSARLNADFRSNSKNVAPKLEPKAESKGNDQVDEHEYSNEFTCQAEVQPFQPQRKSNPPRIYGFQTATVVGPEGEEIFSDKFGRIKVQFHWDRLGNNDADSSCWIRVSQVWAGNRWGAFFWPRVGHEVVVAFENGDPDLPLIVGSVYNAKNMPPMPLPDRLHSSGIKSCSVGGNPIENFSCVIFHDGKGDEYLQMHSETHECMTSESGKLSLNSGTHLVFKGTSTNVLELFGSGSGGGPSTADTSKKTGPVPAADQSTERLSSNIKQLLDDLGISGSGSGGLITEILEGRELYGGKEHQTRGANAEAAEEATGIGNGVSSLGIVCGDAIAKHFGAKFEHVFAPKVSLVADIEEMIMDFSLGPWTGGAGATKELIQAALWGAGGNVSQTYGNNQQVTYGHKLDVHRGEHLQVSQDHFFSWDPVPGDKAWGCLDAEYTQFAVKALAISVLLVSIAYGIAMKWLMEHAPEAPKEGNDRTAKHDGDANHSGFADPKLAENGENWPGADSYKDAGAHHGSGEHEHYHAWEEAIEKKNYWQTMVEARLIGLQLTLEKIYAELEHLNTHVVLAEDEVALAAEEIERAVACDAKANKVSIHTSTLEKQNEQTKGTFEFLHLSLTGFWLICAGAYAAEKDNS